MKKVSFTNKPVVVTNPLNSEIWLCSDFNQGKDIDGTVFVTVYKPENTSRTFLMRKDALRLSSKVF